MEKQTERLNQKFNFSHSHTCATFISLGPANQFAVTTEKRHRTRKSFMLEERLKPRFIYSGRQEKCFACAPLGACRGYKSKF